MARSDLHQAALDLASKGIPVFPCIAGTKVPASDHGFHDATTDRGQIDAWWEADPNFNVAFQPQKAGLAVLDPDGETGLNAWAALELEHGNAPETFTVRTPGGGLHLYFRGDLPPSQSLLGPKLDTRGGGSYVLWPPSRTDKGTYRVEVDAPPAPLPAWVGECLEAARRHKATKAAANVELDTPSNVGRAIQYAKQAKPAVEGEMGDKTTFVLACELLNLGLSEEKALEVLLDHWNERCDPPWDADDLAVKVSNAAAYAQNEAGAWAVEPAAVTFGPALDKLAVLDEGAARPDPFRAWTLEELKARPPLSWLVPQMIPEHGLVLLYGPGDSFKSFIALNTGLTLAKGGKRVLYVCGEGGEGVSQRAEAWKLGHEADGSLPFGVVEAMPWASDPDMVRQFIERHKDDPPTLVIVDTAARMAVGLNENDARDMGQLVVACNAIQGGLGCAVLIIHHTGKDVSRGARGSDALLFATDAAFEVKANHDVRAVEVICRRMKEAKRPDAPWTYRGQEMGGSLVFWPTTLAEHKALTNADDAIAPKRIGKALLEIMQDKRGPSNGVTTHVLAMHLTMEEGLGDEDHQVKAGHVAKLLGQRAKGSLAAYCDGDGNDRVWYLP